MVTYRQLERELGIPFATLKSWSWLDRSSVDTARASIFANGKAERLHGKSARERRQERAESRRGGSGVRRPPGRRERDESPGSELITMTIRSESLPGGEKVIECKPEDVKFWADTQRALASSDSALANARKTRYTSDQFVHGLIDAVVNAIHRRDADMHARTTEQWFGADLLRELSLCTDADERQRLVGRAHRAQTNYLNRWQDDDLSSVLRQAVSET